MAVTRWGPLHPHRWPPGLPGQPHVCQMVSAAPHRRDGSQHRPRTDRAAHCPEDYSV